MSTPSSQPPVKRAAIWVFALVSLSIIPLWLASLVTDPMESGRLRNALIAEVGRPSDFTWNPAARPPDFLANQGTPAPEAEAVVKEVLHTPGQGGFAKALALAQYLLKTGGHGGEIKSDFATTLRKITTENIGYCADFSRAMEGLLTAAGVPVRRWGFSFDGYGGHGHAFVEAFDEQYGWVFLDVFNGFYVRDRATGKPLSVLEFRRRLADKAGDFEIVRINPAFLGFKNNDALIEYFYRGNGQYFLAWGANLFDYENQPIVKAVHKFSRSAEQLAGIAVGVYPVMKILPVAGSEKEIQGIMRLKWALYGSLAGETLLSVVWLWYLLKKKPASTIRPPGSSTEPSWNA